jgi:hypothetical protein
MLKTRIHRLCDETGFSLEKLQNKTNKNDYTFRRYLVMDYLRSKKFKPAEVAAIFKTNRANAYHCSKVIKRTIETGYPKWVCNMHNELHRSEKRIKQSKDEFFIYKSLVS